MFSGWEQGMDCSVSGAQTCTGKLGGQVLMGRVLASQVVGDGVGGSSGKEGAWPRSQGEKALVASWPLRPRDEAARSSQKQIPFEKFTGA